jgi:hypothetical protein
MTRRGLAVGLLTILCLFLLTSCARHFVAHGPVALAVDESLADGELYAQWLGTSAWIISRGRDVVIVDPFFTRPSAWAVASSLLFRGIADGLGYDVTRIRDVLPRLPADSKALLLGHAHYASVPAPHGAAAAPGRGHPLRAGWNKVADYPQSLLTVLKPRIVVLSHYDNFFSPYKNSEDPAVDMRFVMFADYEGFIQRLKELQPTYGFEYRAPKTCQCLRFPGPAGALPCEK